MARLDINSLQAIRALKQSDKQKLDDSAAFMRYHCLAYLHHEITSLADKQELVKSHPEIAAQVYYHFDDKDLAGMLVSNYLKHNNGQLRELATGVKFLLNARSQSNGRLENVLGMYSLPINQIDDVESRDDLYDNAEKAAEERRYSQ